MVVAFPFTVTNQDVDSLKENCQLTTIFCNYFPQVCVCNICNGGNLLETLTNIIFQEKEGTFL